jgi:hypothetical protein
MAGRTYAQALAVDPDLRRVAARREADRTTAGATVHHAVHSINYASVASTRGPAQCAKVKSGTRAASPGCSWSPGVALLAARGRNTFNMLTALENWVEKDQAPDSVLGITPPPDSRPLCVSEHATYDGVGDPPGPSWLREATQATATTEET